MPPCNTPSLPLAVPPAAFQLSRGLLFTLPPRILILPALGYRLPNSLFTLRVSQCRHSNVHYNGITLKTSTGDTREVSFGEEIRRRCILSEMTISCQNCVSEEKLTLAKRFQGEVWKLLQCFLLSFNNWDMG